MQAPLIAIVGDANKTRDPVLAKKAAEELGAELARKGCRILVFSSDPEFIEYDVVRGYLRDEVKRPPRAIQIRYPPHMHLLFPGERDDDELFDRQPQGSEWEVSFYPCLAAVDGLLLIGGGYTTKVTGLIATGSKTPMISLAGLGGAAESVLEYLRQERHSIATEAELNLMAQRAWTATSATHCVDALLDQAERRRTLNSQTELLKSEKKRVHGLTILAVVGSLLFMAVLLAIAEAMHSDQTPRWLMWILFGAPAAAGASGAGWLTPELAIGIRRVQGVKRLGRKIGNWLSRSQAQELVDAASKTDLRGWRDGAIVGLLLGCGLRRSEVVGLTLEQLQMREGRWVIVDLIGMELSLSHPGTGSIYRIEPPLQIRG